MSEVWHILPNGDLIEHEVSTSCACIPLVEAQPADDGSMGWVVTHSAWDGRSDRPDK